MKAEELGSHTVVALTAPGGYSGTRIPPPTHPREEERIARLLGFDILDTEIDPILDLLTQIASRITGAPISLISMVDRDRQWVKSHYGTELKESPRDDSFCTYTILEAEKIFIVPDTLKDPRFANNPFVTGEPHVRFYAGIPLHSGDGLAIGSLCIIDSKPRELTPEQTTILTDLAQIAVNYLEVHRSNRELTRLLYHEKEVYNLLLRSSTEMATTALTFDDAINTIMRHLDPNLGWLSYRIRNMQSGKMTDIFFNPQLPKDPELETLWTSIDSHSDHSATEYSKTEFISTGKLHPEYSYLVLPVRFKGRLMALMEIIFPDHRKMDPRIKEVFELLASNLSIVAERELVNVELQNQATHDPLTGAVNRTVFISELEKAIAGADPLHPDSVLLFIDIDGFKEVNDNFGHQTGDRLLVEVTQRLQGLCRDKDLLGRLSGDEFVLLIRNLKDTTTPLEHLLERIQRNLTQPYMLGNLEIRISTSIGCALINNSDLSTPELLRRSEEAMYLVKSGERKGYCITDEKIIAEFKERRNLDHKIREAINDKTMFLAFQPIVDVETGKICSAEVLLRVLDKEGNILDAARFMESLERTQMIAEVDEWVFAEAIRLLSQNMKEFSLVPHFQLSINVSPTILATSEYVQFCLSLLQVAKVPPSMLRLEVVESHLQTTNPIVLENIISLRKAGIQIAIDDFGTGYSNLQYLTTFPINTIKIDRLFLSGILTKNAKMNELLAAIVGVGKNLGYTLIAEGVEEQAQALHLQKLGCTMLQGYLYGKPMRLEEFLVILKGQFPASAVTP